MKARTLEIGDVVQISSTAGGFFPGCFMQVTDPKSFGAQGFILIPTDNDSNPGRAYFRVSWKDMEYIGKASWVIKSKE